MIIRRKICNKNSKQYWKFLNSLKLQNKHSSSNLSELYEYFKSLNTSEHQTPDISDFQFSNNNNEVLDSRTTHDEISRCIDRLNNGKSPGLDHILNEHMVFSLLKTYFLQFTRNFLISFLIPADSQNNS